ncbi:MAG TPA: thiocillin family RiPP, partial [Blastocatellia bacterium]|nr:thiocillin family RiPP [Blastocatellia bacterium]
SKLLIQPEQEIRGRERMNYTTENQIETPKNDSLSNGIANQPADLLDLFAEELPTQHDLKPTQTFGCIGTASSTAGSCFSSLSTLSTL